jgi:NitT/TauT family transport system permease protein
VKLQHTLARSLVAVRTWPFFIDLGLACCALAIFAAFVHTGEYWLGKPIPVIPISHSVSALPVYAFYSIFRIGIAYLLSLSFAVAYGYTAAYNRRLEAWMIALLDSKTITRCCARRPMDFRQSRCRAIAMPT